MTGPAEIFKAKIAAAERAGQIAPVVADALRLLVKSKTAKHFGTRRRARIQLDQQLKIITTAGLREYHEFISPDGAK